MFPLAWFELGGVAFVGAALLSFTHHSSICLARTRWRRDAVDEEHGAVQLVVHNLIQVRVRIGIRLWRQLAVVNLVAQRR